MAYICVATPSSCSLIAINVLVEAEEAFDDTNDACLMSHKLVT